MSELELANIVSDIDSAIDDSGLYDYDPGDAVIDREDGNVETAESAVDEGESQQQEAPTEISSEEEKARENGWKPKDEYDGDGWVDAGEFNRRAELFDKMSSQNKVIKSLNKKLDALVKHNQNLEQRTREKVIAELEQKRREAVSYGDTAAFDDAERQLNEVRSEESALNVDDAPAQEIPTAVAEFAARNKWFESDKEMTDYMLFKTQSLVANSGMSLDAAISTAEQDVKKLFAHKFKNPNKARPSSAMSGSQQRAPAQKSMSSLTPEQKQVWHSLKGVMSEKEFLEQLGS